MYISRMTLAILAVGFTVIIAPIRHLPRRLLQPSSLLFCARSCGN